MYNMLNATSFLCARVDRVVDRAVGNRHHQESLRADARGCRNPQEQDACCHYPTGQSVVSGGQCCTRSLHRRHVTLF